METEHEVEARLKVVEKALEEKVAAREIVLKAIAHKKGRDPENEKRRDELHADIEKLQVEQGDLTKRIKELRKNHKQLSDKELVIARRRLLTDYSPEAFDTCPVSHVVGLVLDDGRDHGVAFYVISGDRRDGIAQRYGHMSQAQLVHLHEIDPVHYAPANPVNSSTHEYFNGGNGGTPAFHSLPVGAKIDASKLGLDLRTNEEATEFCADMKQIGYEFFQPYPTTSEAHHVCCAENPVPNLVKRGRA
jgi:hypothetical protein